MLYLIKEPLRRRYMPGEVVYLADRAEADHLIKSGVIEPLSRNKRESIEGEMVGDPLPPAPSDLYPANAVDLPVVLAKKATAAPASKSKPKDKVVAIKPAPEPSEGA